MTQAPYSCKKGLFLGGQQIIDVVGVGPIVYEKAWKYPADRTPFDGVLVYGIPNKNGTEILKKTGVTEIFTKRIINKAIREKEGDSALKIVYYKDLRDAYREAVDKIMDRERTVIPWDIITG